MVVPKELRCENGHRMQYVREPHMRGYGHIYCNICQRGPIDVESEGIYTCITCNYDACTECYERETGGHLGDGERSVRPRSHGGEPTPEEEQGKPRLEPYQPKRKHIPGEEVHEDYSCDGCNKRPIVGKRYKCQVCKNYDLCSECYDSGKGRHEEHSFGAVTSGVSFQVHRSLPELQEMGESYFDMVNNGNIDDLMALFSPESLVSMKTWGLTFQGKEKITKLLETLASVNFKVIDRLYLIDDKKQRIASQGRSVVKQNEKEEESSICHFFGFCNGLISSVEVFTDMEVLPQLKKSKL